MSASILLYKDGIGNGHRAVNTARAKLELRRASRDDDVRLAVAAAEEVARTELCVRARARNVEQGGVPEEVS